MRSKKHAVIVSALVCLIVGVLLASPFRLFAAPEFALQFDGVDDRVTFGAAPQLGAPAFTLELWFMRTGTGTVASTGTGGVSAVPLLTKGRGEAEGSNVDMNYFLGIEPTKRVLTADFEDTVGGVNHPVTGKTAICDNIWYHAAATYDGTTWRLYLNGELDAELVVGAFTPRSDSIQHAALGTAMTSTGVPQGFFKGQMDEVRIWNAARSQAAIQAAMGGPLSTGANLIGRWGLDEGTLVTALNSVGLPNGTLAPGVPQTPPVWVAGGSGYVSTPLPPGNYGMRFTAAPAADYVTFGAATQALGASQFTIETMFRRDAAGVTTSTGTGGLTAAIPLVTKGRAELEASNVDMNYFLGISTSGANPVLAADFEEGAAGAHPGDNHPISGTTPIVNGVWYHAAVTYDGQKLQLYLNGAPEGTALQVGQPPRFDSIQHAALGSALTSTGVAAGFFAGTLDEARIWNYARTPQQIAAGVTREIPSASGLLARWGLNECCGRVLDSTGHAVAANGTLFGTGWTWVATPAFAGAVNTVPMVNAGPDHTVVLPATGTLPGTVVDDGTNTGQPLAILWTQQSGPGTASVGNPSLPTTSVTFPAIGTYAFTLTANDGELAASDSITIVVDGVVNQAPVADAGADQSITLPVDAVALSGGATDDGLPGGSLTYQWSKVSGPGTVSFANASLASTAASFAAEGAYVLKLHVSDGQLASDDTIGVTVSPSATNSAIQFGGTNAAVTFGPAPHLGAAAFTLEAWIRRDGAGVATFTGTGGITAVPLVTKGMAETEGGPQDMNYFLGISSTTGALAADFEDTATGGNHPITGGTPIVADGRWHHVAASYNGTTWQLFLDGQLDGSLVVGAFTPRFDSIQHAALGTALNSTGVVTSGQTQGFFNGVLDEVRIWSYARSQTQIMSGLVREIPAASGLLGHWGLNEGSGVVAGDSAGGNVTGTIAGSNWNWVSGAHLAGAPNAAPIADAGPDKTITLPGPGLLIGSASDDGLSGRAVTTLWSQVSGPAPAIFGDAASVVSTVDFTALGTYVLRLSASDGELTSSDEVQILVDGVINQAPAVEAGPDQAITLPGNIVSLSGVVTDDGLGGPLTSQWTTVSGPAGVVFANAATASTTATFMADGTYVLRLSASDGILSASDTVTIAVAPDAANKALKFLGTNAFVTLGPAANLGLKTFTLETWFRRDGAGVATFTGTGGVTAIPLITKGMAEVDQIDNRDMNYFLGIRQTDGVLVADFEDTATAANHPLAGSIPIAVGPAWHHAAATYDGTTLRLFLDGVPQGALTVGLTPRFDSIQHAALGGALNSTGGVGSQPQGFFNGLLDEARIWSYARSTGQIQRGRLREIAQQTPGLVARYGMNETTGAQAASSAGAGPTGDIIGTGWSRVSGAPFVGVNHAPAAGDDAVTTDEDASIVITVLGNDSDVDGDALSISSAGAAAHGSATVNPDGTITYLPAANYQGADSFTYTVSDGQGASAIGTVAVTVTAVNDAPVAAADAASTNEDTAVTISVLSNDSDGDGDAIAPAIVSAPSNGAAVVHADGTIEYTPASNFFGADSFTYKVSDGTADSGTVTVVVTINGVNDAPMAAADSYAVDEDASLLVEAPGVLGNDGDADEDPLGVSLVSGPAHGGLTLNADGSFVYTPDTNFNGADSFTYQVNDGVADSGVVTVTLTVHPVNDAPTAAEDSYTTAEDTPLVVGAAGVLSNDSDLDGDALHAVLVSGPDNGVLALNADGSFTYTPNANFNGADSFSYKSSDGAAESGVVAVSLTVSAVNDAPAAVEDSYTTSEDTPLTVAAAGVLSNDTDVEGGALTTVLVSGPSHGTLTLNADGSFSYVPAGDYHGPDSFSYKADDGADSSDVTTVSIAVDAVNDAPVAGDDSYATVEDTALTIPAAGVLANDADVDGMQTLQAILVDGPGHGTLALDGNGGFVYTPTADYHGADSFTYKAGDGTADSNVATVTIAVSSVNDAPVAVAESFGINEDTVLSVSAPGVLANDTDAEGTALSITIVSGPSHGLLASNPDGSFTYTPEANFHGADSFTYRAGDGTAFSDAATVSIGVTSVNDAPVAADDTAGTTEDTAVLVAAPGVLGNDSDADGTPLTAILVSGPAHGTLILNPDGSYRYEPAPNYSGADSFTYKANDGSADSAAATVAIVIGDVSDTPVAEPDTFATNEDAPLSIPAPGVLVNDANPDGGALTAVLITGTSHGTLQLNANGGFTYTPAANYHGSDSFTYQASGAGATSNVVTVSLSVASVGDAPIARPNTYTKNEDVALTVAAPGLLGNDSDADGEPLTAVVVSGPSHGTLALNGDGSFVYTPVANYNGPDGFTYSASDGTLLSAPAAVTITVRAVNDAPVAVGESYSVNEDGLLTIAAPGVLANDTDVEGSALTAVRVSNPAHGTLTLNADGSFTYRPAANYRGPDSFTYRARDGSTNSNVATVSLTVVSVNDAPVAASQSKSLNEDATRAVTLSATDADGDALTYAIVTPPAHGVLTGTAPNVTYVPQANYNGPDSFTFVARDGSLTSNVATVSLVVSPVNDAPVAQAAAYSTPRNSAFGGNLVASDVDGNSLTYVITTQPTKGVVLVNSSTGGFIYIPGAGKTGADSFRFRVNDGTTNSNIARIDITIR